MISQPGKKLLQTRIAPLDYTVDISIIPGSELDGTKVGKLFIKTKELVVKNGRMRNLYLRQ